MDAPSENVTNVEENKDNRLTPIVRPPNHGAYFLNEKTGAFVRLEAGKNEDLQVTNADRGFGFVQPVGTVISDPGKIWTIWSKMMNLRNMQITRYDGKVLLQENWIDDPGMANIAWLPSFTLPANKNENEIEEAVIQVEIEKNLRPGFYILHDDSFLMGQQREDVTAYYPFIVSSESKKEQAWLNHAEGCFKKIFAQYENVFQSGVQNNYKALRACAEKQHLAMKMAKTNDVKQKLRKQLLFLSSLANPSMTEVKNMLFEQMAANGDELSLWFWKKTHSDALDKLTEVASCLKRGVDYADLLPGLYSYYLGTLMPPVLDLEAFIWIPFTYLDKNSDVVKLLFASITEKTDDWKLLLVQILGAIEVKRLQKVAQTNPELKDWIDQLMQNNARYFSELIEDVRVLDKPLTVAIGPFEFQGLTPEEEAEVEQKSIAHEKQLISCYHGFERRIGKRATAFMLEILLDKQIMGRDLTATMKDPFEAHRRIPAVDAEFVQCARHALSDIALRPSLDPNKSVSMMVATSGQKISPWLK